MGPLVRGFRDVEVDPRNLLPMSNNLEFTSLRVDSNSVVKVDTNLFWTDKLISAPPGLCPPNPAALCSLTLPYLARLVPFLPGERTKLGIASCKMSHTSKLTSATCPLDILQKFACLKAYIIL